MALNTDDEVFSPYIKGILEGDENVDEKLDALHGILTEITDNGIDELCQDILKKWTLKEAEEPSKDDVVKVDVDEKLARLIGKQAKCVVTTKVRSKEEENLKNAILAQYAQVSDGEVTDSDQDDEGSGGIGIRNTNVEEVFKAEREKREKDKEEAQRKREKDKEDRAKQKSKDEDRKEKEKKRTQKGERRR